jgi:hypothetical protein
MMTIRTMFLATLAALAPLGACNDDAAAPADVTTTASDADAVASDTALETASDAAPIVVATKPSVTVTELGGGVRRARIDATDETTWVQFALATGTQVTATGGADGWDLAFQRIVIRTAHPIAVLDQSFASVTQAPADGYVEDGETLAFEQLGEWWNYNPIHHTVTPKLRAFIVRIDAETYIKLGIRDYYDDAGSTGLVTFDWAPVAKP